MVHHTHSIPEAYFHTSELFTLHSLTDLHGPAWLGSLLYLSKAPRVRLLDLDPDTYLEDEISWIWVPKYYRIS